MLTSMLLVLAAANSEVVAPPTPPAAKPKKERLICRTTQVTGSRLRGKRVCRTAEDWDRAEQNTQESAREVIQGNQGVVSPTPLR
jgi:hypothetical protein